MANFALPPAFARSCANFDKYPFNILLRHIHGAYQLRAADERLRSREPELLSLENDTHIATKDVLPDGRAQKLMLVSEKEVQEWLGITLSTNATDGTEVIVASKADPRCRLM
jgi:hypothetical protein